MQPSVRAALPKWFAHFEGCPQDETGAYMYIDVVNVVTVGLGFAIFNAASAYNYKWTKPDGTQAPLDLVCKEFQGLHILGNAAKHSASYFAPYTTIRLSQEEVQKSLGYKIDWYESKVSSYFPAYKTWPAGAQMALMDMSWALGQYFPPHWPKFSACMSQGDWAGAALECTSAAEPAPRKAARIKLLENASLEPTVVPWP